MVRWAKSWQTPACAARAPRRPACSPWSAPGANSNSVCRRVHSSSSASTIGRSGAKVDRAYSIAATDGVAAGEARTNWRASSVSTAGSRCSRSRACSQRRSPTIGRIARRSRTSTIEVAVTVSVAVALEHGEVGDPVAEEVAPLAVVLGERVDRQRGRVRLLALGLARVQVGLAVAGRHVGLVRRSGCGGRRDRSCPTLLLLAEERAGRRRHGHDPLGQLMGEVGGVERGAEVGEQRRDVGEEGRAAAAAAQRCRRCRSGRRTEPARWCRRGSRRWPARRAAPRSRPAPSPSGAGHRPHRVGQPGDLVGERAGVVDVEHQQVEHRLDLGVGAVPTAVGDDALGRGQHRLDAAGCRWRRRGGSSSWPAAGAHSCSARSRRRPASMNCQPSSRTIDSAESPARASMAAITRPRAPVTAATGQVAVEHGEVALEVADDEPGVVRELVADLGGGAQHRPHRVGHRARPGRRRRAGPGTRGRARPGARRRPRSSPTKPG